MNSPDTPKLTASATRVLRVALLATVLAITGVVGYTAVGLLESSSVPRSTAATTGPRVNPFASQDGLQLVAYIVTASNCGWSSTPAMMSLVGSVRDSLIADLDSQFTSVRVVAVVLDDTLANGWRFIQELSGGKPELAFDQVIVGGSWMNESIQKWVWKDGVVEAASPQVFLVAREITSSSYLDDSRIRLGSERIVARHVGSSQIHSWLTSGASVGAVGDAANP